MYRALHDGARTVEVLTRWGPDSSDGWVLPPDLSIVRSVLYRLVSEPQNASILREIVADRSPGIAVNRLADHEVVERIAWDVFCGQLALQLREPALTGGSGGTSAAPAATAPPGEEPETQTHWIEFLVLHDETDQPASNVKLKVKLSTGQVAEYTTGADGMVRIDGIPAGACDIVAVVDRDALEVVKVV